jgi:hypothetical protein
LENAIPTLKAPQPKDKIESPEKVKKSPPKKTDSQKRKKGAYAKRARKIVSEFAVSACILNTII